MTLTENFTPQVAGIMIITYILSIFLSRWIIIQHYKKREERQYFPTLDMFFCLAPLINTVLILSISLEELWDKFITRYYKTHNKIDIVKWFWRK